MLFLKFQLSTIDIKENNWILDIDLYFVTLEYLLIEVLFWSSTLLLWLWSKELYFISIINTTSKWFYLVWLEEGVCYDQCVL